MRMTWETLPSIEEGKELIELSLCLMGKVQPHKAKAIGQVLIRYLAFCEQEGRVSPEEREEYIHRAGQALEDGKEVNHVHQ